VSGGGWFHVRLQVIGRSDGRSAVACAAYRTGVRLLDMHYEKVHDYTKKHDVVCAFTLMPLGTEAWAWDAEVLWNAAEEREYRKNSQLAYEWEIALPHLLDAGPREIIAREFSQWLVTQYSVGVTTGVHGGGKNGRNDHMHVMMTTRAIGPEGWHSHKMRQFSVKSGMPNPEVIKVREQVATIINRALAKAGYADRVDHRRIERRLRPAIGNRAAE
jgi:hypothetical protein